jgi:sn-glycerol 3-phosphate transport system substrate-binding protein
MTPVPAPRRRHHHRRRRPSVALTALVATLVLAGACSSSGSGSSSSGAGATRPSGSDLPPCPLDALASATQPVEVVLWHPLAAKTKESLEQLAAQYNASQSKVRVRVESQGNYVEIWKKFQSGARNGDLPAIAVLEDVSFQAVADSGVVLPAQSCINASNTDMSDFVPSAIDSYSIDGTFYPATVNPSSPLLYFNRNHFRRAGLDPTKPPTTLAELRTAAEKIKAAGIVDKPLALSLQAWFYDTWMTGAKAPMVDNDNGRGSGTTTAAAFDTEQGREVMAWIAGMVRDGLADPIPYGGGGSADVGQFLALGTQKSSMTVETSTAATSIKAFLSGDTSVAAGNSTAGVDLNALDIDAAKMPGVREPGKVQISGNAWYLTNTTSPEVQAAAWDFMTWWNATPAQVQWNLQGSYLPFRVSAAKDAAIVDAWRNDIAGRWLAISYDQLLTGIDPDFPGPLIGPYDQVRDAVETGLDNVSFANEAPDAAVTKAAGESTKAIEAYNKEL